jgi:hypothetical protein
LVRCFLAGRYLVGGCGFQRPKYSWKATSAAFLANSGLGWCDAQRLSRFSYSNGASPNRGAGGWFRPGRVTGIGNPSASAGGLGDCAAKSILSADFSAWDATRRSHEEADKPSVLAAGWMPAFCSGGRRNSSRWFTILPYGICTEASRFDNSWNGAHTHKHTELSTRGFWLALNLLQQALKSLQIH